MTLNFQHDKHNCSKETLSKFEIEKTDITYLFYIKLKVEVALCYIVKIARSQDYWLNTYSYLVDEP